MADKFDPDVVELLERRLADEVAARVRTQLFRYYVASGSVAIFILGLVGFNIITSAKDAMTTFLEDGLERSLDSVEARVIDATVQIRTSQALLDQASAAQKKLEALYDSANSQVENIGRMADAAAPSIDRIQEFTGQVDTLSNRTRDIQSALSAHETTAQQLDDILGQLPDLANQVAELANLVAALSASIPDGPSALQSSAVNVANTTTGISDSATSAIDSITAARENPTVFVQYHAMPAATAAEIAARLSASDFTVPGTENARMPDAGLSEIRYFHEGDRPKAAVLEDVVSRMLLSLGIAALPVQVKSFTDWPRLKPKVGTLELWIGLPVLKETDPT